MMGWNDGQTYYELYFGNAQSGALSSTGMYNLPHGSMNKEGAVLLGIGGDNSEGSQGYFFERLMTSGVPSGSSLNSIQANIVSAGYLAAPVTLKDGVAYTFVNQNSQLALGNDCDGCSGPPTNGAPVVQGTFTGQAWQQWTLHAQSNGFSRW